MQGYLVIFTVPSCVLMSLLAHFLLFLQITQFIHTAFSGDYFLDTSDDSLDPLVVQVFAAELETPLTID